MANLELQVPTQRMAEYIVYGSTDFRIIEFIVDILDIRDDNEFIDQVIEAAQKLKEERT